MTKKEVTAKELREFIRSAHHAYTALVALSIKWEQYEGLDETLCDGYPFGMDLENQVWQVATWIDRLEDNHAIMLTKESEANDHSRATL